MKKYLLPISYWVTFTILCSVFLLEYEEATQYYRNGNYYLGNYGKVSFWFAMCSAIYCSLFLVWNITVLQKIRIKSIKQLVIISMIITFIMIIWSFLMMSSPRGIGVDEVIIAWHVYIVLITAFTIIIVSYLSEPELPAVIKDLKPD